jgi:hypothetical protein
VVDGQTFAVSRLSRIGVQVGITELITVNKLGEPVLVDTPDMPRVAPITMTLAEPAGVTFFANWFRDVREGGAKAPHRDIRLEAFDAAMQLKLRVTLADSLVFAQEGAQVGFQPTSLVVESLDGPTGGAPGAFQVGIRSTSNLVDAARVRGGTLTTTLVEQRVSSPKGSLEIRYVPGITKASRAMVAGLAPDIAVRTWITRTLEQDPRELYQNVNVTVKAADEVGGLTDFKTFERALLSRITLFNPLSAEDGFVSGLVDLEMQPETVTVP